MGKTLKYVKDFDFNVKPCEYSYGGKVSESKHRMPDGKMMKNSEMPGYKKGGAVKEKATGEVYASRKAMAKHEMEETPRMQREEVMQRATVKAPRKGVPVAPVGPLLAMKKGGMTKAAAAKIPKVMSEYKAGELHSGSKSGPVVKSRKQAVAIAMSEARQAAKKK